MSEVTNEDPGSTATAESEHASDDSDAGMVIVGVDGSAGSQRALEWAANKTDVLGPIKGIGAYHVEPLGDGMGTPGLYTDLTGLLAEDAKNQLQRSLEATHPDILARSEVVRGYPGPALVRAAEGHALLVVGSRGRSALAETLLGSVTSYCVKHATVPVAVIPESTPVDGPLNHLIVGADGSENAVAAMRWAIRHLAPGGRITAIHSWLIAPYVVEMVPPTPSMSDEARVAIEQSIARAVKEESATNPAAADTSIEIKTLMGDPRNVLPAEAKNGDLLVIGARGHRGAAYLLVGSVATSLIHHPTVPTVVVPGAD